MYTPGVFWKTSKKRNPFKGKEGFPVVLPTVIINKSKQLSVKIIAWIIDLWWLFNLSKYFYYKKKKIQTLCYPHFLWNQEAWKSRIYCNYIDSKSVPWIVEFHSTPLPPSSNKLFQFIPNSNYPFVNGKYSK